MAIKEHSIRIRYTNIGQFNRLWKDSISRVVETAPNLAISKFQFFHNFNAVFELSAISISNIYGIETLPACSSMKDCWLELLISDRFFLLR